MFIISRSYNTAILINDVMHSLNFISLSLRKIQICKAYVKFKKSI